MLVFMEDDVEVKTWTWQVWRMKGSETLLGFIMEHVKSFGVAI